MTPFVLLRVRVLLRKVGFVFGDERQRPMRGRTGVGSGALEQGELGVGLEQRSSARCGGLGGTGWLGTGALQLRTR